MFNYEFIIFKHPCLYYSIEMPEKLICWSYITIPNLIFLSGIKQNFSWLPIWIITAGRSPGPVYPLITFNGLIHFVGFFEIKNELVHLPLKWEGFDTDDIIIVNFHMQPSLLFRLECSKRSADLLMLRSPLILKWVIPIVTN